MHIEESVWCDPHAMLRGVVAAGYQDVCLLYSGLKTGYSGRYSYLAYGCTHLLDGSVSACLSDSTLPHWFGVIPYEAYAEYGLPATDVTINTPRIGYYTHVIRFDHEEHVCLYEGVRGGLPEPVTQDGYCDMPAEVAAFSSPMSQATYVSLLEDALEAIRAGSFYQVNLTRKFCITFAQAPDLLHAASLFTQLCARSPAPYSAFLAHQGHMTLSSSPELFLEVDAQRIITTRPIKGTLAREHDAQMLAESGKDRAENLMIVDLMRNDLSRCCRAGSVSVPELFDVDSFATLHHLSSTITGRLRDGVTLDDVLAATFPPGSMTGAPKAAAMDWIAQAEAVQRGIYSGAIGWMHNGQCALSVVIRTLVMRGAVAEFQVGGGIVHDSVPLAEYQEIRTKARALCSVLGVDIAALDRL